MSELQLRDVRVHFLLENAVVRAVDGVSFDVRESETLVLVGESGSGKSVLGTAILRLLPENARVGGEIWFNGENLLEMTEEEMRRIRGREIAWIPQNSSTSLNPVLNVGSQVAEPLEVHMKLRRSAALRRVVELFNFFGIKQLRGGFTSTHISSVRDG